MVRQRIPIWQVSSKTYPNLEECSGLTAPSAAPQPLTGKIYTHFNTKVCPPPEPPWVRPWVTDDNTSTQWSFFVFFGIFEIGSVLCGAAVSSAMLIVGRAVAGFGAAGIINGAITIISSCAPLEKRPGEGTHLIALSVEGRR